MAISHAVSRSARTPQVLVWDPLVRWGHWLLVLAFAIAYLSAEEESGGPSAWHVWSGYVIGCVVVVRVLWGFIGSSHARFRDFVYGPGQVVRYLADMLTGHPRRYLGHSPAGGAMAVALLVCLAGTVATGLIAYGEEGKGPLAGIASVVTTSAHADEDANSASASSLGEPKREEGALEEVHNMLANVTLTLVAFHILGVLVSSLVHRENLVAAMIHGRERPAVCCGGQNTSGDIVIGLNPTAAARRNHHLIRGGRTTGGGSGNPNLSLIYSPFPALGSKRPL